MTCGKCGSNIPEPGPCPVCNDAPFGTLGARDYRASAENPEKFDQAVKLIEQTGDEAVAKDMIVAIILDPSYPRADIGLAIKEVKQRTGWILD